MENLEPKYDERKGCGCTLAFLSITAIIISVLALALVEPRTLKINEWGDIDSGFDYLGFIIGILALMMTLMVGWNIWQTIDTKSNVKTFEKKTAHYDRDLQEKADCIKRELEKEFEEKEKVLYNHLTLLLYETILGKQPHCPKKHIPLFQILSMALDGLALANKQGDEATIVALLEYMRNRIEKAKSEQLSEEQISNLLQRLREIGLSETPDKLVVRLQKGLATFNEPKPHPFHEDEPIVEDPSVAHS